MCYCVLMFICSSGRDKICTVWNLKGRKAKRTVPVYEVRLWNLEDIQTMHISNALNN